MFCRRIAPLAPLAEGQRLVVPVLAAAGGSGRSTVAGLLALGLATAGRTVLVDAAPAAASPWPGWVARPGAGTAALVAAGEAVRPAEVFAAASRLSARLAADLHVLTDTVGTMPPVGWPGDEPRPWLSWAGVGHWARVVVDSQLPLAAGLAASVHTGQPGAATRWLALPDAVPVLVAPSCGRGGEQLLATVGAADRLGLPTVGWVLALVDFAPGRPPARLRASLALLADRVHAVIRVGYDPRIRAVGLREPERLPAASARAGLRLAHAVRGALAARTASTVHKRPTNIRVGAPNRAPVSEGRRDEPVGACGSAAG